MDEIAYVLQARIFAGGWISVPTLHGGAQYFAQFVTDGNRMHSMFPPGHSLHLAIGEVFGIIGMIPPLLGGFSLLLWVAWLRNSMTKPQPGCG